MWPLLLFSSRSTNDSTSKMRIWIFVFLGYALNPICFLCLIFRQWLDYKWTVMLSKSEFCFFLSLNFDWFDEMSWWWFFDMSFIYFLTCLMIVMLKNFWWYYILSDSRYKIHSTPDNLELKSLVINGARMHLLCKMYLCPLSISTACCFQIMCLAFRWTG